MSKFSYKTTKNSLLRLIQASPKNTLQYISQFERVAMNYELNDREEFMKRFFQKSFHKAPIEI